ncbi:MAG: cupin domain-containing protein [Cytophagales bacterium]|nr:cupin domain-containing protein [Cytophagales bacterium]
MKYLTTTLFCLILMSLSLSAQQSSSPTMNSAFFSIDQLEKELQDSGRPWLPFLQGENVLAGLYFLNAGSEDNQQPHETDEIYYVLSGAAMFEVDDEKRPVKAGDVLFVKADINHRFYDIEEDLKLLVFFDQ